MPTIRLTDGNDVRNLPNLLDTTVLALGGDDTVTVSGNLNEVRGNSGNDQLTSTAADSGVAGEAVLAQTTVIGGDDADRLRASADAEGQEAEVQAIARALGKEGADDILVESTGFGESSGGPFGPSSLRVTAVGFGDEGRDTIRGSATARDVTEDIVNAHFVGDGGADGDTIVGSTSTDSGEAVQYALAEATGGDAADTINLSALVTGSSNFEMEAKALAEGGGGDDNITLNAEVAYDNVFGTTIDAVAEGHGGPGNDTIRATATISAPDFPEVEHGRASIVLRGNDGNDVLVATVEGPSGETFDGVSNAKVFGGPGNDQMSVHGGRNNLLSGKEGNDLAILDSGSLAFDGSQVVGGSGTDTLRLLGSDDLNLDQAKASGVEVLDLNGSGKTLTLSDVLQSDNDVLTIRGDASNTVELQGELADAPQENVTIGGQQFTQVTADGAGAALIQQIVDITTTSDAATATT